MGMAFIPDPSPGSSHGPSPVPRVVPQSPPDGLLVVTIDRLPAWMLPAWGATWVSTPALDALAGRGLVFDRLIAAALDPRDTLADLAAAGGLWRQAASAGWPVAIVTDDPALPPWNAAVERFEVPAVATTTTADRSEDTNAARLCAKAREVIAAGRHRVVWCHAGSLGVAWDAPDHFREGYVDPDDPPPPAGASVPNLSVAADTDPDLVVGIRQVFAGQLTLLDRCLGELFEAAASGGRWAVLVVGLRGMPLGLHGIVGCEPGNPPGGLPYGEWVHLPAIFVHPDGRMAGQRYDGLVVPADLGATLLDLVRGTGAPAAEARPAGTSLVGLLDSWTAPTRDRVIVSAGDWAAIVTPAWHLVAERPRDEATKPARLFAKPDDFFELTDVANRCAPVANELEQVLEPLWRGSGSAGCQQPLSAEASGRS